MTELVIPLTRLVASQPFRRSFPDIAALIGELLFGYGFGLATLTLVYPILLRVAAVIAVGVLAQLKQLNRKLN